MVENSRGSVLMKNPQLTYRQGPVAGVIASTPIDMIAKSTVWLRSSGDLEQVMCSDPPRGLAKALLEVARPREPMPVQGCLQRPHGVHVQKSAIPGDFRS